MSKFAIKILTLACLVFLESSASAQMPIRAAYNAQSGDFIPVWIAEDKGFFRKNGLNVELVFISGTVAMHALAANEVSVAFMNGSTAVNAALRGLDAVIIATYIDKVIYSIAARPEIREPQELRGRTIGVGIYGGAPDLILRTALVSWGLNPDRDVRIFQLFGSHPTRMAAVLSKRVDAAVIGPPITLKARKLGLSIIGFEKVIPEFLGAGIITTREFLLKREESAKSFVKALVEAIHYMKTHKRETIDVVAKYLKVEDREILEDTYEFYSRLISRVPATKEDGVNAVLAMLKKKALPDNFINSQIVNDLERDGYFDRLYGGVTSKGE